MNFLFPMEVCLQNKDFAHLRVFQYFFRLWSPQREIKGTWAELKRKSSPTLNMLVDMQKQNQENLFSPMQG